MDNDNILDNGDDHEFTVPDTQESPATFSRKVIKNIGICQSSMGTDAVTNNNTVSCVFSTCLLKVNFVI